MKFTTYATDLQILPESDEEIQQLVQYCVDNNLAFNRHYSNVKGQDWHSKAFIEIPFRSDLLEEIKTKLAKQEKK